MSAVDKIQTLEILKNDTPSGRRKIFTDIEPNSPKNVLKILEDALAIHLINRAEIKRLIYHYLGVHDICGRATQYSSNVNNKVVLNYAQSIVRDIVGYTFGKDIEYVPRDIKNSDAVLELASILQFEDAPLEDIITATYCSICGIGYQCMLASDDYKKNPETGIKIGHLNPLNTFAVYSYEFKNPIVLTCTYYETNDGTIYTVFTKDKKYVITDLDKKKIDEGNLHGLTKNPITVFENNQFLLGDFETALTILDAIDLVGSDSVNDIENFVRSLLVFVNASLGDTETERAEMRKNIKENRVIEIKAPQGMQADAKYITQQLNPETTKTVREYLEESLWKIVGIPDRKTRGGGGGDTGDAVKLRDGWADIEVVARNKEKFFRKSKKEQIALALNILKPINKKLKDLKARDVESKFSRNKNDNLQTKSQAYSTLIATETLDPRDALEMADMTTNVNEVIARGETYQKKLIEQALKLEQARTNPNNGGNTDGSTDDKTKGNITTKKSEVSAMRKTTTENNTNK